MHVNNGILYKLMWINWFNFDVFFMDNIFHMYHVIFSFLLFISIQSWWKSITYFQSPKQWNFTKKRLNIKAKPCVLLIEPFSFKIHREFSKNIYSAKLSSNPFCHLLSRPFLLEPLRRSLNPCPSQFQAIKEKLGLTL